MIDRLLPVINGGYLRSNGHSCCGVLRRCALVFCALLTLWSPAGRAEHFASSPSPIELKSKCLQGANRLWWFGKCWCEQGWIMSKDGDPALPTCTTPLLSIGDCDCFPDQPNNRSFLTDVSWMHETGYRCTALCRSTAELGVPRAIPQEWMDNQIWRQLGFYKKELPQTRHNHLRGRLDEFTKAYSDWGFLQGSSLGNVLELGAGAYTQTKNILEHVNANIDHATLVDPLIHEYLKISRCPYLGGALKFNDTSVPVTLHDISIEEYGKTVMAPRLLQNSFDTVILMNVLVYAQDALKILEIMYASLKMGGLLLFHDRYFEDIAKSSRCKTSGFTVNVIQVSKTLLDHFLDHFSTGPYFNTNQTDEQLSRSVNWCLRLDNEMGYFVAVRKTKKVLL